MKNIFNFCLCLFFAIIFASLKEARAQPYGHYPNGLYTYQHYLPSTEFQTMATLFTRYYQIKVGTDPQYALRDAEIFESTNYTAFATFENELTGHDNDVDAQGNRIHQPDKFFHAFKIYYGLELQGDNKYKFRFVYVPVFADYANSPDVNLDAFNITPATGPTTSEENNYYLLGADGSFVKQTGADITKVNQWLGDYTNYIYIDRGGNNNFSRHNRLNTANGDARGELFSFKEVFAYFSAGNIYIVSNTKQDYFHGLNTYKHIVAFSTTNPTGTNYRSVCADLGTMCPPGSSVLTSYNGIPITLFNAFSAYKVNDTKKNKDVVLDNLNPYPQFSWLKLCIIGFGILLAGVLIGYAWNKSRI